MISRSRVFWGKNLFPGVMMLAMLTGMLQAQQKGHDGPPPNGSGGMSLKHEPNLDHQVAWLTGMLSLSSEQQAKLREIMREHNQRMDQLFREKTGASSQAQNQPPNREAMHSMHDAFKAIQVDTYAKINVLLNDNQKAIFAAWQKKQARPLGHPDDMPPPLDGTDDSHAK